ncbi:MAG: arylsulfatase A family protein [Opitutaceae bacterium]|nr:arylsulfatase A family protein [Opitutaceae bacterium]
MKSLLLLILLLAPAAKLQSASVPNIAFIIADDLGVSDTGFMGNPDVRTPALDAFAARSTIFERLYVASPSCAPSRGAMLSGIMPFRNGAEPNHTYVRDDVVQLPHYMRDLGYQIAAIGKIAHGTDKRAGFDFVDRDISLEKIGMVSEYLSQRESDKPLLLMVGIKDPHVPWPDRPFAHYAPDSLTIPDKLVDTPDTRLELARYYTDVERMDKQVAATLEAIENYLGPETIIFFTSDHGAQLPYGKWSNYESGVRVPMLVSWPGVAESGRRSQALVSFVDILPTLIEIAGGTPPKSGYGSGQIDGRSFLKLIKGDSQRHRDYVFSTNSSAAHHTYPLRSVCSDRYRYIRNVYPELNFTCQTDHNPTAQSHNLWLSWVKVAKTDPSVARKVRYYHQRPAEELYDLQADPNEQRNLGADPDHLQTLRKLRAITDDWIRLSGDTLEMHGEPMQLLYPQEH